MITLTLDTYKVSATHMIDGWDCEIEVEAMDAGEALHKVETGGVFAANDVCKVGEWSI